MRRLLLLPTILCSLFISCSNTHQTTDNNHADMLYQELKALVIKHIDSISMAVDSASIAHSIESYETELNKCIFHHPAGTDMHLSQGQQDTLAMLTDKFLALKHSKTNKLANANDSLPSDTIAEN